MSTAVTSLAMYHLPRESLLAIPLLFLAGFFAMARRAGSPPAIALLTVLAYALIARSRFELRPQMFNLAATMALYQFVFLSRPSLRPRQLLAIGAACREKFSQPDSSAAQADPMKNRLETSTVPAASKAVSTWRFS